MKAATKLVSGIRGMRARHTARHRPSGFQVVLADRVDYLNPAHWDAVTAGASVFTSRRYLSALDGAHPANVTPRYALVFDGERPIAAACMQFADLGGRDLVAERADAPEPAAARARRGLSGLVRARVLVCGNLLAWGRHGVTFAAGVDPATAWPGVADALYRARSAERHARKADFVLVKDLGAADAAGIGSLETYSYRPFETEPDMVLDLPEKVRTLSDYLGLFRSKYKKGAKAVIAESDAAGYALEPVTDWSTHEGAFHRLYLDVRSKANVRLFTLHPEYLPRIAAALGDDFRAVALVRAGAPAGFVSVVRDGAAAVAYYMGFDRAANASAPVYFRLLYAAVELSLAMGCRRVSFGRTALEPKSRLGAKPVPLRCWVRHRVPVLNVAMRRWLREMPHDTAPDRSPLRDVGE